ncbi:AMP-binding protein [Actinokineospora fastidiosa]|uniref:Long-chain acyl-CoA synthetase n=1 Tax=Actinokineospora fastidiosa TaxID=1816 RepID=A0A918GDG2_9PSEU|nr:AMP-binding protein [Actinokineospora fastidiosa]GGS30141.1 long-chain acyl-CoA synthetase [Actinokineospora fastidiosa]
MQWLATAVERLDTLDAIAVEEMSSSGAPRRYSYGDVLGAAVRLGEAVLESARDRESPTSTIGILTGNGVESVVGDLACLLTGVRSVPIPIAFGRDQARHLLSHSVVCLVDEQGRKRLAEWGSEADMLPDGCVVIPVDVPGGHDIEEITARVRAAAAFSGDAICKIVHTSGTTSTPKGVMLRRGAVDDLITSITTRVGVEAWQRYVSVVPTSLLVEQVFAVYLTFLAGGTVVFLPEEAKPLGTAGGDVEQVRGLLAAARPTVSLTPPSLVESIAAFARTMPDATARELSLAVYGREDPMLLFSGGAPVSDEVLRAMWDRGLPVYVAYGLSENGSVATLNGPGLVRLGTVGKPLRHCEVRRSERGELLIRSSSLLTGYLGSDDPTALPLDDEGWLHTGDVAEIDADGYVSITGRLKNIIITSNGRNVSPEWVEAQYKSRPSVEAAAVFGDNLERLIGVFVVRRGADAETALAEIRHVNAEVLSEIEQVGSAAIVEADEAFYAEFFTVTGRPRRAAIREALAAGRFPLAEV